MLERRALGPDDELGTLNFIDPTVRLAALATVELGRPVSIGKDLDTVTSSANPFRSSTACCTTVTRARSRRSISVEVAPHGFSVTHLDAIGHVYFEGAIYNGRRAADVVTAKA